ncbi:MAG: hypothetical protein HQM08_08050 [Candidatus Riflebacteria bacterium]|nr:hypothetical protein [Candidatus Riflebacteria bacterium]
MMIQKNNSILNLLLIFLFILLPISAFATAADFRVPDWYEFKPRIQSWDGKGKLELVLETKAKFADIRDLSIIVHFPGGKTTDLPKTSVPLIKSHSSQVSVFSLDVSTPLSGWIDFEISAKPNIEQFQEYADKCATFSAEFRVLLQGELKNFKAPLAIGFSVPISVKPEIAALDIEELLFTEIEAGLSKPIFLWAPKGNFGKEQIAEYYSKFQDALSKKDLKNALDICVKIEKVLPSSEKNISFVDEKKKETFLNKEVLTEILKANRETLHSFINPQAGIKKLEKFSRTGTQSYFHSYILANSGLLCESSGKKAEAVTFYKQAVSESPGWQLIINWIKELEGK